MKVAVAQFNPTVGAVWDNLAKMRRWVADARGRGAELIVFPELSLVGYPPRDLLDRPAFLAQVREATASLVAGVPEGVTVVFGSLGSPPSGPGLPLTNDAVAARGGREIARVGKRLLPTYDVFDEARHFRPGESDGWAQLTPGFSALLSVCEDAWGQAVGFDRRYPRDPLAALEAPDAPPGPRWLVNLSASPFTLDKRHLRDSIFRDVARRHATGVIMANQVGANDELIFDGSSAVWGPDGRLLARARSFEEQLLLVDLDVALAADSSEPEPEPLNGEGEADPSARDAYRALVLGVRDYARKCGFERAVLGLSGGIDSAVTAVIAADALGRENVLGVAMPARYSSQGSVVDARALAMNLGIDFEVIDVDPLFSAFIDTLGPVLDRMGRAGESDVSLENVQARVRGATLMAISNRTGALVLTTGNKSELAVGYCTLYGDMVGGLAVISDVPKTLVYRLARFINREVERIPLSSIEKAPSAELRPDQKDEDSLPPYDRLDAVLELYIEEHLSEREIARRGFDPAEVRRVVELVQRSEYKRRQAAPGLILTRKAFGLGRRIPVASGFREREEAR